MNVEEDFPKSRIHSFLKDITELCKKHKVSIYAGVTTTIVNFDKWEDFSDLDADPISSSVYWPRIETHVVYKEKSNG